MKKRIQKHKKQIKQHNNSLIKSQESREKVLTRKEISIDDVDDSFFKRNSLSERYKQQVSYLLQPKIKG